MRVLLTGATGYVGGRLAPRLLDAGYRVRCVVRDPGKLANREWATHPNAEILPGDVADTEGLIDRMHECDAAFYLVHSMISAGGDYAQRARTLAESFRTASEQAGVRRIIYLGGLGEMGENLSDHLRSRREVERVLADGPVPVTVFRAAMIIGSGSASYEILRYLVERLPAMITPRWVKTECQPVAIADMLHWLVRCLKTPETIGRTFEVGGDGVRTYTSLMHTMAAKLELPKRVIVPVPVLTPELSSRWIGLVTPVTARIARPLAEGLRNRVVARDAAIREVVDLDPIPPRGAIDPALQRLESQNVETFWPAAGVIEGDPDWAGGRSDEDTATERSDASPNDVFRAVCRKKGPRFG